MYNPAYAVTNDLGVQASLPSSLVRGAKRLGDVIGTDAKKREITPEESVKCKLADAAQKDAYGLLAEHLMQERGYLPTQVCRIKRRRSLKMAFIKDMAYLEESGRIYAFRLGFDDQFIERVG